MALTTPLALMDTCGTTHSIAREVDGNVTPPKSLCGLSVTAGKSAPHSELEFIGYTSNKDVKYCRFASAGSCGTAGPIYVCSCLIYNPAMVSGDRFDANFCYEISAGFKGVASMTIRCQGTTILYRCVTQSIDSGSVTVQDIDPGDAVTMYVCAKSTGSVSCAETTLTSVTDQQGSSFVVGSPDNEFVVTT